MAAGTSVVDGTSPKGPSAGSNRPRSVLPPNAFAVSFGLAGLAQCWSTARDLVGAPGAVAAVLWTLTGVVYLSLLAAYVHNVISTRRGLRDVTDPVLGPFTALILIVPLLLGVGLAHHHRLSGEILFLASLVATAVYGGWLSGQWIARPLTLAQWHPGYFLPTVAGGLIASGGAAVLGHPDLARLMFGYGMICWIVLGSIMLTRLFTQPCLPVPLLPTIAIELAPPVVAGNAWFLINGGRADTIAWMLAGYALLMVLVQLSLIQIYRRVPFALGWWSYSFSYAAAFTVTVRWLVVEQVPAHRPLTYLLVTILTTALAALVVPTVVKLARGTLLPRRPAATTSGAVEAPDPLAPAEVSPAAPTAGLTDQ
jgi:tellurite resistance protein